MEEKFSIKVNVAERYYPLRIDRNEEERIRKAARMINDKVLQYKQRYRDKDIQDFLAMAALQFVKKALEFEDNNDMEILNETLSVLDNKLENILAEQN